MRPPGDIPTDAEVDANATASYMAVLINLFPPDHPGQVRTIGDDDAALLSTPAPPPFPEVPGFNILERLARGGSGEVYRAWEAAPSRMVALKFMRAATAEHAIRLELEAKCLARCRHPNIVQVYQVAAHASAGVFLAMEYIKGATLDVWLKTARRKPRDILRIMTQVGCALEAAHTEGIVHRDIQPKNIMVDEQGGARLIDFGLANLADLPPSPTPGRPRPLVGTGDYIAPEHRGGDVCTTRSDQFSFCVVMYQSLYGGLPNLDAARLIAPRRPGLRRRARQALLRGLQLLPSDRFPGMGPLLHALAPGPWWRHPAMFVLAAALLGYSAVAAWSTKRAAIQTEADIADCVRSFAAKRGELFKLSNQLGLVGNAKANADDHESLCHAAISSESPRKLNETLHVMECLDSHIQALHMFSRLPPDDLSRQVNPRLRLEWGKPLSPLPPFPMCELRASSAPDPLNHVQKQQDVVTARHLVQLRMLLQHQLFREAHRLLVGEAIIERLEEFGDHAGLAETLLYAGQVARRYRQQNRILKIADRDADQLLNSAEVAAKRSNHDFLVAFIQLERVNLAIDTNRLKDAEMLLEHANLQPTTDTPELDVRRIQTKARMAFARGDTEVALSHVDAALTASGPLAATTLGVELLGARAIYLADLDPSHAHTAYGEAVTAALEALGPRHHLTGIIAANASRHAFGVGESERGVSWAKAGLAAFAGTFGSGSKAVQQLEYDLAYNLLLHGEADRALEHADLALGHARELESAQEVTFTLQMRSLIELRLGRRAAAMRSIDESIDSFPAKLHQQLGYKLALDLTRMTIEAEIGPTPRLEARLRALQAELEQRPSFAFPESLIELRLLRARVLATLKRPREALALVSQVTPEQLAATLQDPLLLGDVHLLRAHLAERTDPDAARRDACAAIQQYTRAGTDGRRRLISLAGVRSDLPPAPSQSAFATCPPPP
jgi:serine/threonine protein kinase